MNDKECLQDVGRRCPVCGHSSFLNDPVNGEMVCPECGAVVEDKVLCAEEECRRLPAYGRVRVETEMLYNRGVYSVVGQFNVDASSSPLSGAARADAQRLRFAENVVNSREPSFRTMAAAFPILNSIASKLSLPESIKEDAGNLVSKVVKRRLHRGRSLLTVVTACVYIACRENGVCWTLSDLAKCSGEKRKRLAKAYRDILKVVGKNVSPIKVEAAVSRITASAGLNDLVRRRTLDLVEKMKEHGIHCGKHPMAFAAAAVYVVARMMSYNVTEKLLAELAGVTVTSVRLNVRRVREFVRKCLVQTPLL
ncbi:MAG: TFIIB-type zinc ribbon-containing protein [Candidatus Bathyarchaeia archaeon]